MFSSSTSSCRNGGHWLRGHRMRFAGTSGRLGQLLLWSIVVAVLTVPLVQHSAVAQPAQERSLLIGGQGVIGSARPNKVALVIGNSAYKFVGPLKNTANDARLIGRTLSRLGFALVGGGPLLDLDKGGFDEAIQSFSRQMVGAEIALFYYAGHGVQVGRGNFLVPVSANPTREADLDFQMIDANLVLRQMGESGTRLNIVILDACRNDPFAGKGMRSAGGGLAQMEAPQGTLISYATQPGAVASDGDGEDSPYTTALAASIQIPGQGLFDVFNAVGVAVETGTAGAQQPWVSSSPIDGHFFFAVAETGQAAMATMSPALPPPAREEAEIVYWQSIASGSDPAAFEAYMERFPKGFFIEVARLRLAELKPASSVPVERVPDQPLARDMVVNVTEGFFFRQQGHYQVHVLGEVINISDHPQKVPGLTAAISDSQGNLLLNVQFSPREVEGRRLAHGASASFDVNAPVPAAAASVTVSIDPGVQ